MYQFVVTRREGKDRITHRIEVVHSPERDETTFGNLLPF